MSIFDEIKSFSYDKNRERLYGIKSAIVWGHSKDSNTIFPLLYISKPRSISQEDYELLLDKLQIFMEYERE